MQHFYMIPAVAGVFVAGVIVISPSFADPYETSFVSEEPLFEQEVLRDLERADQMAKAPDAKVSTARMWP